MLYGLHDIAICWTESRSTTITPRSMHLRKTLTMQFCFFDITNLTSFHQGTAILQKQLQIGKGNLLEDLQKLQKNPIFHISVDISRTQTSLGHSLHQQIPFYLHSDRSLLHDNIVPKPDLALELGKSISLTEAEEEAVAREVHATHARIVSGPDPEPMQEDQTGSNSGKLHVSLAGPNPEHILSSNIILPFREDKCLIRRENQCFIVLLSGALFQPHRRRDILSFMSITKRVFKGVEIFDQRGVHIGTFKDGDGDTVFQQNQVHNRVLISTVSFEDINESFKSRSNTLRNEEICGGLANAHNTDTRRGSDNVPHSFNRDHKRNFIRKKGRRTCSHIFRKQSSTGAGLMLIDPKGKEYTYALRFEFETTNNEAKYEALLAGLRITQEMEIISLAIFKTKEALKGFDDYTIEHIRRNQNKKADALSKLALMTFELLTKEVLIEVLAKRSIEEKEILQVETKEEESWMTHIHESFYIPWLRCVAPPQTDDIVKEIHEGSYGFNTESRLMVVRITKQGYYWPSMNIEAAKAIQDCEKCKEQSAIRKAAENGAMTARNGWPFKHSTKWVEAKPLTTINGRHAERFVWEYVVYKFGVPRTISSKDEKHFREGIFTDLCKGLKVTQSFSPITEHMEIMNHIEKQLTRSQQGWVDDLAQVLWVHRTLPRNSQKETPFSLTYGSEAIIPIAKNAVAKDDRRRTKEVTNRKEGKEVASIEEAYYQNKLRRYHNERSSHSTYKIGDFVLLSQNDTGNPHVWQGPHMISKVREGELYKIIDASDHSLIQTAKGTSLYKFYM
ncbi:reverse transcriptase domain-containing protein [Tanacetum coccineum]